LASATAASASASASPRQSSLLPLLQSLTLLDRFACLPGTLAGDEAPRAVAAAGGGHSVMNSVVQPSLPPPVASPSAAARLL
jgi:hypothetical protein